MWVMVMFDLPVLTDTQRKAANMFRNDLLDRGFEMAQYSVYVRYCPSREHSERHIATVQSFLPRQGRVHILCFTDYQYANMRTFVGTSAGKRHQNPAQFELF